MKSKKLSRGPYGGLKQRSQADRLFLWILQLSLVSISKSVTAVSSTCGRWLALQLYVGRSGLRLLTWLKSIVLHAVAWLFQPALPRQHWIQRWGRAYGIAAFKRVHVLLGEHRMEMWAHQSGRGICTSPRPLQGPQQLRLHSEL
jgi:hypothetical protein